MKIAIVGGPSLGKTTLAMELATELKKQDHNAAFVGEYARTWMAKHGRLPASVEDQAFIMRGQRKRENEAVLSQDIVVTDSTTWMCAVYATQFIRKSSGEIDYSSNVSMNDLLEDCIPESDSYDLTFILPRCFRLRKDRGRVQTTDAEGIRWDHKIIAFTSLFEVPVIVLSEDHKNWLQEVQTIVQSRLTNPISLVGAA